MSNLFHHINESRVAEAFSQQAPVFDREYAANPVIEYKRERVREHVLKYLPAKSSILELNSGTGEDAIFFARKGHHVHATDISEGMQKVMISKIRSTGLHKLISHENCSFHHLDQLENKGPFDLVFSNFGGLNCTGELGKVLDSLSILVKPGGFICLVIIPPFSLWESLFFFKGEFRTATRRFFSAKGRNAMIEGKKFRCWYYRPSYIIKRLRKEFSLVGLEGLCTIVPPSYKEKFLSRHPRFFQFLKSKEDRYRSAWPWKYVGDYFIISLRKEN